ncbi:ferritin-like domain-containing protein [Candidatus Entotheonella palauensis]|uniref:ferritin-like domain-containing protein n=1 Tax=Candidatus Entotheonella palauensis TaxID=93172 RepID=UPI0015C448B2|nr:ferritin-like domain-containing protein [Candidatus Entotheonella palauensis]
MADQRSKLARLLRQASTVEQQLLLVYLYTIFSLKTGPDATCSAAEWESVRRWYSKMLMIARQEMEHLSLVQSMLLAIGEKPYFDRDNLVTVPPPEVEGLAQTPQPIQFPIQLQPFNKQTIEQYVCVESPSWETLVAYHQPIPTWCFTDDENHKNCVLQSFESYIDLDGAKPDEEIGAGSIEILYRHIRDLIEDLDESAFESPYNQAEVVSEYQIFVFPVTGKASALAAVDLITKQGEGSNASHTYTSHFRVFSDILKELETLLKRNPRFEPAYAWQVVHSAAEIPDEKTRDIFTLLNEAYVSLALILAGFYYRFSSASGLSITLQQAAFAPMMTMVIRPLFEILARLPIDGQPDGPRTGPTFYLTPEERQVLADPSITTHYNLRDINLYVDRMDKLRDRLERLRREDYPESVRRDLDFMYQNVYRLSNNLTQIFTQGLLPELASIMGSATCSLLALKK